jgi:sacsin
MTTSNATRTVGGSPFGRIPSLTAQIRELIHDYPEGIGIIKELAQNADDAGARILEIVIDRRTHPAGSLPAPAMAALQGPALLFLNDSVFTEEDFDRIQEIYRSGKVRAADKTGQFGKGFNTVYNVTDWPSFVTGERVAFFDPHCSIVPGAAPHYLLSLDGERFITDLGETLPNGTRLLLLSADAGG